MKKKEQKQKDIEQALDLLKKNNSLILVDFTGLKTDNLNKLREVVKDSGGSFKVFKKRLFKIALAQNDLTVDFMKSFTGQIGAAFSPEGFEETTSLVYKFLKENPVLKIVSGFNLESKEFVESQKVNEIGKLPSREVLIAQVIGMISSPIRKFLYVLDQRAKKVAN